MGKITEISAQKKNDKRVNIYIDGEFAIGIEAIIAAENGLAVGREISKAELDRLALASDGETAFKRALSYIARRPRTRAEIERYLSAKQYDKTVTDATIEKLTEYGYIDDAEFVEIYLREYGERRGKKRLRQDLARMGASEETFEEALGKIDQRAAAEKAADKYLKTHPFDSRKLAAHLASKGFEWEDITSVVRAHGKGEDL